MFFSVHLIVITSFVRSIDFFALILTEPDIGGPFVHHLTMAALAGKAEVDFSKTMEIKLGQNYYDLSKETDLQQRDELSIKYPL